VVLGDLSTPCEVFGRVRRADGGAAYQVRVCSLAPEVESAHVALKVPWRLSSMARAQTVIVPGIDDVDRVIPEPVRRAVRRAFDRGVRVASICTGAFVLAEAGLLDGRRATTHWANLDDFGRRYPEVKLDADRIFIRDGDIWTSAGISAGIDLALALIEEDNGVLVARRTAQQLVVHQRRPGGQLQFSAFVDLGGRTARFVALIDWIRAHLAEPLTVERLADQVAMSPRNFARAFTAEIGLTPAKAVERLRLETARTAVETSRIPLERIAEAHGFGDPGRMRRAFLRSIGQPPQALRRVARANQRIKEEKPPRGAA
jgi:transcriptional regulator GlxA family with amidase domain